MIHSNSVHLCTHFELRDTLQMHCLMFLEDKCKSEYDCKHYIVQLVRMFQDRGLYICF